MFKSLKAVAMTALFISLPTLAEFYKVEVTRVESNLYKTSNGIYIETKYCYEYATREEAILSYDRYATYDNKLIFANGQSCDVVRVMN